MLINNRPTLIIYTQQFANTYIGLVEFQYISGNLLIPETKVCCATLFCTEEWTLVKDRHDCTTKATTIGLILPLNHLRRLLYITSSFKGCFYDMNKNSNKLSLILRTRLDRTTEHSQLKRRSEGSFEAPVLRSQRRLLSYTKKGLCPCFRCFSVQSR